MLKKARIPLIVVIVLMLVGFHYRRSIVLRLVGMRPFVEERFAGWVAAGATEAELDAALRRTYNPIGTGPGSWVYEISRPAAAHEQRAQAAEAAGDIATAAREYHEASVFYFVARFPFLGNAAKEEAYRRQLACYLKAREAEKPPLQIVRIPFEGKEIIGYLRVPPSDTPPPVVVLTGGVDTWKSDIEFQAKSMLAEGMAAFTFDMPGTGESAWPLTADGERIYMRVLEHLKGRPDLDGNRMGVYLQSFAGYFAVKLALMDPNVKAAVNIGGPLELSFTLDHARTVNEAMIKTIAHAMQQDKTQPLEQMVHEIEPFQLGGLGLLQPPARQAPLLSINGDQDPLVTIDDLYIVSKSGIQQEEWVYPGDGHCASANARTHVPEAAAWLRARLDEVEPAAAPEPTEDAPAAVPALS